MRDHQDDLRPQATKVARWDFDAGAGQINAVDGQGRVVMVIPANPLFGPRLAAAFMSPAQAPATGRGFGR